MIYLKRSQRSWFASVLAVCLLAMSGEPLLGQLISQHSMVTKRARGADALRVDTALQCNQATAVCEFSATFTNPKRPSPGDRNFILVLYLHGLGELSPGCVAYSIPITLPEKNRSVSIRVPVVQTFEQAVWNVGVFETGVDIEDKKARPKNSTPYQYVTNYQGTGRLCAGFIQGNEDRNYDIESEILVLRSLIWDHYNANTLGKIPAGSMPFVADVTPLKEMPSVWWQYLTRTFWVVTTDTLSEIVSERPRDADNLRHYLVAGGKLLVIGNGSLTDRGIVEDFLGGARGEPTPWKLVVAAREPWWHVPIEPPPNLAESDAAQVTAATQMVIQNGQAVPQVRSVPPVGSIIVGQTASTGQATQAVETKKKRPLNADAPMTPAGLVQDAWIAAETLVRPGIGQHLQNAVEIIHELDALGPQTSQAIDWSNRQRTRFAEAVETKRSNEVRIGQGSLLLLENSLRQVPEKLISLQLNDVRTNDLPSQVTADGNWFWSNLNRAVGKPPVWAFMALIGTCGLILGPGLLFFTGRLGRRSLMLFLVPFVSFLATMTVIAYGILNEGFETHLRVSSFTVYDAGSNTGLVWSRQNYFSGLPPREGMVFDKQMYVRPVPAIGRSLFMGRDPRRTVDYNLIYEEDHYRSKDWLGPRTQQQMLIGNPADDLQLPVEVQYIVSADTSSLRRDDIAGFGKIEVTNRSAATLPFVALRGATDDYYFCKDLAPGESKEVVEETRNRVEFQISSLLNQLEILPEPPEEMEGGGQLFQFGRSNNRYRSSKSDVASDVVNEGLRTYYLPPLSFLTMLPENPAVYVPLEGIHNQDLHFFKGTNAW